MVSPQMTSPPVSTTTATTTGPSSPPKSAGVNYKPNRFGRPCDACKRRKQRCVFRDGQEDVCVMCEFQNVPCTFTDVGMATPQAARKRSNTQSESTVRKRRQKPNKYVFFGNVRVIELGVRKKKVSGEMGGRVLLLQGLQRRDLWLLLCSIEDRQVYIMPIFLTTSSNFISLSHPWSRKVSIFNIYFPCSSNTITDSSSLSAVQSFATHFGRFR
jgi:Fungal Zn(2)-Cys(6) binuclear cluster domain